MDEALTQRLSSYTHYDDEGDIVTETITPSLGLAGPDLLDGLAQNRELLADVFQSEAQILRTLADYWRADLWRAA